MREEREHACDDAVLSIGTRPVEYADHLLNIVRSLGQSEGPAAALAMARRSQFEGRLLAILDGATQRGGVTRGLGLAALVVAAAAVLPLAALGAALPHDPPARHAAAPHPSVSSALRKDLAAKPMEPKGMLGRLAGRMGKILGRAAGTLQPGDTADTPARVAIPAPPPPALPAAPASAASGASGAAGAAGPPPPPVTSVSLGALGPDVARQVAAAEQRLAAQLQQGGGYADVIRAAESIAGNAERASVLIAVLRRPDVGPVDLAASLRAAAGMSGCPEKRDVLKVAAERHSLGPAAVRAAFFSALSTFTSDPERRDVLMAVLGRADLPPALMLEVVRANNEIPGSAVRRDVLMALLAHGALPPEVLTAVFRSAAAIPSPAAQRDVLVRAAGTQRVDGAARDAYFAAAQGIPGESEKADVLSAMLAGAPGRAARAPSQSARAGGSTTTHIHQDEDNGLWDADVVLTGDHGRVIRVHAQRVVHGGAGDEIRAIRPGGLLTAEEVAAGRTRRVEMRPCASCADGIERTYTVDGRAQPYDAAAQRWLAGVLHEFLGK
jgi:hypothetical protein